jgi:hypothetical protein
MIESMDSYDAGDASDVIFGSRWARARRQFLALSLAAALWFPGVWVATPFRVVGCGFLEHIEEGALNALRAGFDEQNIDADAWDVSLPPGC